MGSATPYGRFPIEIWDGTTSTTPDVLTDKAPDTELAARYRAEIRALETVLISYLGALEKLNAYGAGDSVFGVKADGTELEYKILIDGPGIVVTHTPAGITFSTGLRGVAGEALAVGDVLYLKADGKVYKAKADADATSMATGISDRVAVLDDAILILSFGAVTNSSWTLTVGDVYYLDPAVAGGITKTIPTTAGQSVVPCGVAVSTTSMAINFRTRVKL